MAPAAVPLPFSISAHAGSFLANELRNIEKKNQARGRDISNN
jgi:hypothetical protein